MAAGQPWDRHFFRSIDFTLKKRDYLHNATTSTLTAAARNECGRRLLLKIAVHANRQYVNFSRRELPDCRYRARASSLLAMH